jgi:NTE family protein
MAGGVRIGRPALNSAPLPADNGAMDDVRPLLPLAAVYGGGGPFGIAYGLGIAHALRDAGVPLQSAPALGTSAGSWVAACLAAGVGYETLAAVPQVRVPDPRPGLLRGLARELFGTGTLPGVRVSAVRLPRPVRRILDADEMPVADLIAASSSVPGLFAPTLVGRRLYVDGGVRSMVSADHAMPARHLLAVAPVAGPMFGAGGRAMELMLHREVERWRRRCGGEVHVVRPNALIASMARHPFDLFDQKRACDVYPLAYEQMVTLLATRESLAKFVADTAVPVAVPAPPAPVRRRRAAARRPRPLPGAANA